MIIVEIVKQILHNEYGELIELGGNEIVTLDVANGIIRHAEFARKEAECGLSKTPETLTMSCLIDRESLRFAQDTIGEESL